MPSKLVRPALFLSAYTPLLVLLAVLRSFGSDWSSYVCGGLAGLGLLGTWAYWRTALASQSDWLVATRNRGKDGDVLNFFITYVVPFAAAPLTDTRARVGLVLFVAFVGALYLRAGLYHVHPLLLLVGYHLYEVELADGSSIGLLTKRSFLPQSVTLKGVPLVPNVFVEKT